MALPWTAPQLAMLEGGALRPAAVLRIASDPVVRLWIGQVRDLALPGDTVEDVDGAIYQSMGLLTDIPVIEQLLNGDAQRISFGLSGVGVTSELAALASADIETVRSAQVNFGVLFFDANWQVATPVLWPWDGEADSLTVEWQGGEDGARRSISLSVGSIMTGRRRPFNKLFTDDDQQRSHPGDLFFDQVARYSEGSTKVWPI